MDRFLAGESIDSLVDDFHPLGPDTYDSVQDAIRSMCLEVIGIQATSHNGGNVASRVHKIEDSKELLRAIDNRIQIQVWGWKDGKLKRVEEIN